MSKKTNKETESDLYAIKAGLNADVENFVNELKAKHLEEPQEYPLDNGGDINDWFVEHINQRDW